MNYYATIESKNAMHPWIEIDAISAMGAKRAASVQLDYGVRGDILVLVALVKPRHITKIIYRYEKIIGDDTTWKEIK